MALEDDGLNSRVVVIGAPSLRAAAAEQEMRVLLQALGAAFLVLEPPDGSSEALEGQQVQC